MQSSLPRSLQAYVQHLLTFFPAVALLGPRQSGKTTLAKACASALGAEGAVYLDLERGKEREKLKDPDVFFEAHASQMVVLDEIQNVPALFPELRGIIDENRRPGRFLILGSASPDLLRQSSETLAGRIAMVELSPLTFLEAQAADIGLDARWMRGGFPGSLLATSDVEAMQWREAYIRLFLERDIPQLGFRVPAKTLERFWTMAAHLHAQPLNQSHLGQAMDVTHHTIRHYADILTQTFMVRLLQPYQANLGKRLVKTPKLYVRDSGILHALLRIPDREASFGHPSLGASWEGFVIEEILANIPDTVQASFYRTATGDELDLVLEYGLKRVAIECKASSAPNVTKGFWNSLADLKMDHALVVAPIQGEGYPLKGATIRVAGLSEAVPQVREWLGVGLR